MGGKNPAISIIVPTYNVEKYVTYCVDSILGQTFRDYEIVIVDDVSSDDTYEICKMLYGALDCVTLIRNSVNKGQWYARNMGIKKARGKYIYFMDDDDELVPEALEVLYNKAEEEQADAVHSNFYAIVYSEDRMLPRKSIWKNCRCGDIGEGVLKGTPAERLHYQGAMSMPMPWLNLYNREFLLKEGIEFPKMVFGEDNIFAVDVCLKAKRYVRINRLLYLYRNYFDKKGRMVGRFPKIFPYVPIFLEGWNRIFSAFSEEELSFEARRSFVSSWLMAHLRFGVYDIMNTDDKEAFSTVKNHLSPVCSEGGEFTTYLVNMLEHACGFRERISAERSQKREVAKSFILDLKKGRCKYAQDYRYIYSESRLAAYIEEGDDVFYKEVHAYWADAALNLCKYQEAMAVYEKSLSYISAQAEEYWQILAKRLAILPLTDYSQEDINEVEKEYDVLIDVIKPFTYDSYNGKNKKKLRLGVVLAGNANYWFAIYYGILLCNDKDNFEIYCYHYGENSGYTNFLRNRISRFVDARELSCNELAEIIHSNGIDVLLDLTGNSEQGFWPLLAYRPAPVQIAGVERISRIGFDSIDCFLTDDVLGNNNASLKDSEKMLVLPCRYSYALRNDIPLPNETLMMRNKGITLGIFARYRQISDDMLVLWREIMEQLPEARLLMNVEEFSEITMRVEAMERLSKIGFEMNRVDIEGPDEDNIFRYLNVDILLGTYPIMEPMRVLDSLYMGVPVIAMYGKRKDTKSVLSILKRVNMEEFATDNPCDYLGKVVSLANNLDKLDTLRKNLRNRVENASELHPAKWTRKLETKIRELVYLR